MNVTSFGLAVALLVCAVPPPALAQAGDAARGAAEILPKFVRAWSHSDANGIAALFAPDADFVNPWGTYAAGRQEIAAFYEAAFQNGFAGSKGEAEIVAVRELSPGLAIIDAQWRISGAKMPDGTPRPDEKGILACVVGEASAGWRILALRENASATDISPLTANKK